MLADPRELSRPPPEIRLPPNASISQHPLSNADPSYMRSTINAVPTTTSLLSKSRLPFTLVLTPNRSLKEGDVSAMHHQWRMIRTYAQFSHLGTYPRPSAHSHCSL